MSRKSDKRTEKAFVIALLTGLGVTGIALAFGADFALVPGVIAGLAVFGAERSNRLVSWWPSLANNARESRYFAASGASAAWFDRVLEPNLPLPRLSGWALEPDSAGYLVRLVQRQEPQTVVEIGSGVSTLLVAYALEQLGAGRVIALEPEAKYADQTRGWLEAHGLTHRAQVITASLEEQTFEGWQGRWLSTDAIDSIQAESVELLIVDGPPSETSKEARFPAVPALLSKLKDGATVLVDDAHRADERRSIARWVESGQIEPDYIQLPLGTGLCVAKIAHSRE